MAKRTQTTLDRGAVIVPFPLERTRQPEPVTCLDCDHVTAGTRGLYCTQFNEWIIYDDIAEECSEFRPL